MILALYEVKIQTSERQNWNPIVLQILSCLLSLQCKLGHLHKQMGKSRGNIVSFQGSLGIAERRNCGTKSNGYSIIHLHWILIELRNMSTWAGVNWGPSLTVQIHNSAWLGAIFPAFGLGFYLYSRAEQGFCCRCKADASFCCSNRKNSSETGIEITTN